MNIQFIYDTIELNYSILECYSIYDFEENKLVEDVKRKKTLVVLDRNNKTIYFVGMEVEEHWILEKNYFYKIIQEFMKQAKDYNCEDYIVHEGTSGGKIYYKYN